LQKRLADGDINLEELNLVFKVNVLNQLSRRVKLFGVKFEIFCHHILEMYSLSVLYFSTDELT
jgi:hypothetical protein